MKQNKKSKCSIVGMAKDKKHYIVKVGRNKYTLIESGYVMVID